MIHKDICIPFTLKDREFEAVGFLKEGEENITLEEVLKRTDNGQIVNEDDWSFVYNHRHELPHELEEYYLLTKWPRPGNPRLVSCLYHDGGVWRGHWLWHDLDNDWRDYDLVLRRRRKESTMDLKELIKKAELDDVNSDINETNFPNECEPNKNVEILESPKLMSGWELLTYIKEQGYEPATLSDLVQFSVDHYDDMKKYWGVLALGSRWQDPDGGVYVPCAYQDGEERGLSLTCLEGEFDPRWRVLVSRKAPDTQEPHEETKTVERTLRNLMKRRRQWKVGIFAPGVLNLLNNMKIKVLKAAICCFVHHRGWCKTLHKEFNQDKPWSSGCPFLDAMFSCLNPPKFYERN